MTMKVNSCHLLSLLQSLQSKGLSLKVVWFFRIFSHLSPLRPSQVRPPQHRAFMPFGCTRESSRLTATRVFWERTDDQYIALIHWGPEVGLGLGWGNLVLGNLQEPRMILLLAGTLKLSRGWKMSPLLLGSYSCGQFECSGKPMKATRAKRRKATKIRSAPLDSPASQVFRESALSWKRFLGTVFRTWTPKHQRNEEKFLTSDLLVQFCPISMN